MCSSDLFSKPVQGKLGSMVPKFTGDSGDLSLTGMVVSALVAAIVFYFAKQFLAEKGLDREALAAVADSTGVGSVDALETANTDRIPPANLGAACDALEADTVFVEAFGPTAVENFLAIKRDEWGKFTQAVTDWELNYYLPYL